MTPHDPDEPGEARLDAEAAYLADPIRYHLFNPAQVRAIRALDDEGLAVLILDMGNGSGKTFSVGAILGAIIFGTANPLFRSKFFTDWSYPKELRIVSTTEAVKDRGPIQEAIRTLWPRGRYTQSRGSGKGYYSQGRSDTGWGWDILTYNQAPIEFSAHTKGLNVYIEPPPAAIYSENQTRLRAGGLTIIDITPLDYAPWIKDDLIDPGALILDGKEVGKVKTITGTIWDNCRDLHRGGQLPRNAVERTIASWPEDEREARLTGAFMHLAGRIYRRWCDDNEPTELSDYHAECWEKGKVNLVHVLDPHDRKPWAMSWEAIFPNDDSISLAEWPGGLFHRMDGSPISDIEDYRVAILDMEEALGRQAEARLIDPNFGNAPKAGYGISIKQMLSRACRKCRAPAENPNPAQIKRDAACPHRLHFSDPPDQIELGHQVVRAAVGDISGGKRPKTYALKACRNMCYSMRHYGYKESRDRSKGPSETPELVHKDFADLKRYLYLSGRARYRPPDPERVDLWTPRKRGGNLHVT